MPSDPFDDVREDVATAVAEAEAILQQWRLRHEEPTAKRLLADLESIEIDLADMDSAIESATLNPERFNISEAVLAERRKFVRTTRSTVAAAREEVARGKAPVGKANTKRSSAEERVGLLAANASAAGSSCARDHAGGLDAVRTRQKDVDQGSTHLLGSHASLQQVQLAEQEETIGHLGQAVGRLKQLGGAMNAELASQNAMLNDLESGLDETASGMDALKNKMKALMPKKEPKQKMAIVILSIILVVLLFLVAYT